MLYYLFEYLDSKFDILGAGVFQFISFRAAMAIIFSLLLSLLFGGNAIRYLKKLQVGETVRDLGLAGQSEKSGTPTMGGIIILLAIIIPTLLFARLDNIYILLILLSAIWMGVVGYLDDYIKVFKKEKEGMAGVVKILSQVGLGIIVGSTLYFHDSVVVRKDVEATAGTPISTAIQEKYYVEEVYEEDIIMKDVKALVTTIPFLKDNELNYADILTFMGEGYEDWAWLVYIPIVIFIVAAVSNGANITDGLDGLCIGSTAIIVATLGVFAYVSGNIVFADYLNIMYIPFSGELVVFSAALIGACVGFLWFNSFPAQVFLGDTGSLALGGIVAALAIMVRKELLIPILCGIYLIENLSVILQVGYFKYTKHKTGAGKRLFLMSPLHHHYQKKGIHESKIVIRFWIVGILLAVLTMVTLKLR